MSTSLDAIQDKPLFSVVTPTFNRANFLTNAIKSIQGQTFSDYEHIIVDDGSTDDSASIVDSLSQNDSRIVYLKQKNHGRSHARNTGISRAKGKYVCFLDSDDLWRHDHLENISRAIIERGRPSFIHTGLVWFYDNGTPDQIVTYAPRSNFKSDVEYVIANQFAPDCVCVKLEILKTHQFNHSLMINEDVELWARIACTFPVHSISENSAMLRVHSGNTSNWAPNIVAAQAKAFSLILANPSTKTKLSRKFVSRRLRGLHELRIRQLEHSNQQAKLCFSLIVYLLKYPGSPRNLSKIVLLLYNLPGGKLLRRLISNVKSKSLN